MISYGVPQGSVVRPLLFPIYIDDINEAISYLLVHHFTDNTNVLFSNKSLEKINKYINHDLAQIVSAQIVQWLRANHISLNVNKTDIILFQPKNKKNSRKLNFRVSGQKMEPVNLSRWTPDLELSN